MSVPNHQLELLSPARDADIGIAAINHGADAVYIGGPSFGARAHADNSASDIARLVRHAHRFNARIFVTLNTILRDDELDGARKLAWQMFDAGVDALIIQDMGLLELDLPPIQLHASTQADIRTPEKARFLQDVGLSQIVLARELNLDQIAAIRAQTHCTLEYFVHGALCVAYSGQCYISHAHTGRSANRGDCSQACRLPYQVVDGQGRFVAHDKHVLSMKDNNQSANLSALVDAGIRSFKIEGRYKDLAYVKNITAHYRKLLDQLIEAREVTGRPLSRSSSGSTTFTFTPDPNQNFNREFTDYFVNQRHIDVAALDTPKNPGVPLGYVSQVAADWVELQTNDPGAVLHNGDGLCYFDLQQELVGMALNTAKPVGKAGAGKWRVVPKDPLVELKDLRLGTALNRNRDMSWVRALERASSDRRIGVWVTLEETPDGLALTLTDEDGHQGHATAVLDKMPAKDPARARAALREHLSRFGGSDFCLGTSSQPITLELSQPWFVPASLLNPLRREAVGQLQAARAAAYQRPLRAVPVEPPAPYPEDTLSYLSNVYNTAARDFHARHGVKVIDAAYESHEEPGEVSLMITKHCVRFSLSLCPKQAKGVTGVQGTVKAEPLTLINGKEKLTLRFDCKPCEMHVVGRIRKSILQAAPQSEAGAPLRFYRTRPAGAR
ncbi:peptidase U32 family protein [Rhodoferax sp.]|uniref:peptidase U32 family protein n=1 Tax=Rhodoferax sp. TaxID=50421 RepID=UPI002748968B|nr:U32 family peptidase [Rhodoferax sp.]